MAGKLRRYASQRPAKTNGYRFTSAPGSHFRERPRSRPISSENSKPRDAAPAAMPPACDDRRNREPMIRMIF
jgi:hypothetical protein